MEIWKVTESCTHTQVVNNKRSEVLYTYNSEVEYILIENNHVLHSTSMGTNIQLLDVALGINTINLDNMIYDMNDTISEYLRRITPKPEIDSFIDFSGNYITRLITWEMGYIKCEEFGEFSDYTDFLNKNPQYSY